MEATVITLEPRQESEGAVSFEEAFGGHSELRGRGRARRQARRMDRISKKRERKLAKQEMRQEKRNRRVEGKISRRRMKSDSEREAQLADAEQEQQIEAMQPKEDDGYSSQPQAEEQEMSQDTGGGSYQEEAPEELSQESEPEEEESSFDAETSGPESSFDNETSEAAGGKPKKTRAEMIAWHKKGVDTYGGRITALRKKMQAGNLPSNKVAEYAKVLRDLTTRLKKHQDRLAHLQSMPPEKSNASGMGRLRRRTPVTPVQAGLKPKIETERIEIPSTSSMEGDEFNNFDGKATLKKYQPYIIGVGVAALAIFALHKMNVFKK